MLASHRSAHPIIGGYSFAVLAALAMSGAACAGLVSLVVLPAAPLQRLQNWLRDGLRCFRMDTPSGGTRTTIVLAALALSSYVVISFRFIHINAAPRDDQLDYLNLAGKIHEIGLATLWRQLWAGEYLEANRHPLYTAILSLRPEFSWAQWLSWLLGLGTLALAWYGTSRRAGTLVGGLSAILIATNSVFQQSASLVACEAMLTLWTLMAWFTVERSVQGAAGKQALNRHCIVHCAAMGALLGLAYLTKASGFFLLLGTWVWSLTVAGLRRWSWLAILAFTVISSPLLVRNARAYGNPVYSFNNRFLFSDTFEQGLDRGDRDILTEAGEYWRTHSAAAVGRRALSGLGWEAFILLRSLGPATLSDSRPLVGFVLLLLAALGAVGSDRRIVLAAAAWLIPLLIFFAWYVPIAAGDRFLAPVMPVVLIFSARGGILLLQANAPPGDRLERRILFGAVLWCVAVTMLSFRGPPGASTARAATPFRLRAYDLIARCRHLGSARWATQSHAH